MVCRETLSHGDAVSNTLTAAYSGRNIAHTLLFADGRAFVRGTEAVDTLNGYSSSVYGDEAAQVAPNYARQCYDSSISDDVIFHDITVNGYRANPFAHDTAIPFSAFIADICILDGSISPIGLISNQKPDKKSHELSFDIRRKIFSGILQNAGFENGDSTPTFSIPRIQSETGLDYKLLYFHIDNLQRTGVVDRETNGKRDVANDYQLSPDGSNPNTMESIEQAIRDGNIRQKQAKLIRRLAREFRVGSYSDGQPVSVTSFIELLDEYEGTKSVYFSAPKDETKAKDKERARVLDAFDFLADKGFIVTTEPTIESQDRVRVLKPELIRGYMLGIMKLILCPDEDLLSHYRERAQEIASDPLTMAWLMQVDFERGALMVRRSTEEHAQELRELLTEHPSLDVYEMKDLLGVESLRAMQNILTRTKPYINLASQKVGKRSRYSLAEDIA